ncbi:MAG: anacyclamide/piricyclamide family prenylated cyclic peptide [Cyanobacteria bacterium J06632_19]
MKTKKLNPPNVAPVKRNSVATVCNQIGFNGDVLPNFDPEWMGEGWRERAEKLGVPFAGDDAE